MKLIFLKYDIIIQVSKAIGKLLANINIFQQEGLDCPASLTSQVLMAWWCKESQHQQQWHQPSGPGISWFPHWVTHWVIRPSAHMILVLTMKDDKILVIKVLTTKMCLSYMIHICRISSSLWLKLYFHCQAINTHYIGCSQYHAYWWPGKARRYDMLNQNILGQDSGANIIAADAVAVAPCILVVNDFLIKHKDLFMPHSQFNGCRWPGNVVIHFVISVSRSDNENTDISSCFKINPAQK